MKKTMAKQKKKIDSARRIIIEGRLKSVGLSVTSVANLLNVSHTLISLVIDQRYPYPEPYETTICELIDADREILFSRPMTAKAS